jgi:hypothetical protein
MVRATRGFVPGLLFLALFAAACGGGNGGSETPPPSAENQGGGEGKKAPAMPKTARTDFFIASPTIPHHAAIPNRHTCEGEGISPALRWENPPAAVKSFAIIVDDPDADQRNFVHWILFNIPPEIQSVPENVQGDAVVASLGGAMQGRSGDGKVGWTPICPNPGRAHRIVFRIYAVDQMLDIPAGASRGDVEGALKGHYLGQAAIVSSYARTAPQP